MEAVEKELVRNHDPILYEAILPYVNKMPDAERCSSFRMNFFD